ncbi:MAG: CvpA family protein [Verrucomicrobia bacterium]|jgi:uncharacterized membrane protein required for colicin V production|nr:CvpA family protein [Verrucomicrobiota bacterium]
MNLDKLPFNWFDLVLVAVLIMGIFRGRKRGMSEELMTMLQWIVTVIVCSIGYQPVGVWLANVSLLSLLASYLVAYLLTALGVALAFVIFKRVLHGKLIGSDAFGKAEYYLGMPTGMLRFGCVLLAGLALLNAPLYTQQEIQAYKKFQMENFDSEFFPGLQSLQSYVFEKSLTGPSIKKYLGFLLIKPTASTGNKSLKQKDWTLP